jgi:hypothetical protein
MQNEKNVILSFFKGIAISERFMAFGAGRAELEKTVARLKANYTEVRAIIHSDELTASKVAQIRRLLS